MHIENPILALVDMKFTQIVFLKNPVIIVKIIVKKYRLLLWYITEGSRVKTVPSLPRSWRILIMKPIFTGLK